MTKHCDCEHCDDAYDDGLEEGHREGYAEGHSVGAEEALHHFECPDCKSETQMRDDQTYNLLLDLRYGFELESEEHVQRALAGLFKFHNIKI